VSRQPSGTITFLFTDIEGSTRLLDALGNRWGEVLDEHRRLLRAAFVEGDGYEVDTQGDSFFVAFSRASDAAAAAVSGQRALLANSWPEGTELRVRMGLHTGEPTAADGRYFGIDLHRAARVAAVAHGGQILCTQPTRDLLDGVPFVDLGEHRLKDLAAEQHLYQLCAEGLPQEFPPVRTLGSVPTNLPLQPTALVGRGRELDELCLLLRDPAVRLVTLTGPGGIGKTRLALQAAAELADGFGDGTFFVGLAPIDDPDLVTAEIAHTIGVNLNAGQTIAGFLAGKALLLLLDNLEQLLPAAPRIAELLASAGGLNVIATSREPLRISGERIFPIPPLRGEEAVELFADRARAADPTFELTDGNVASVAAVCDRLDDLPLAIELAAARVNALSPEAMLPRVSELGSGGVRDVPERQRTLQATIDWSYRLLEPDQRELFRNLGVFARGFTLEAAEAVCRARFDEVASLVDKSLLRRTADRFWMLETIRSFALARLSESSEESELRECHAAHFLAVAESSYRRQLLDEAGSRIAADLDNLREALGWFHERDPDRHLQLAGALGWFWKTRSYFAEGLEHLTTAIGDRRREPTALVARALAAEGAIRGLQGDDSGLATLSESVALWRQLGDDAGAAAALDDLGWAHFFRGADDEAEVAFAESLSLRRPLADARAVNRSLAGVCQILVAKGAAEDAARLAAELLELTAAADDSWAEHLALHFTADCALMRGEAVEAERWYTRSLAAAWAAGDRVETAVELQGIAMSTAAAGEAQRALRLAGAADGALAGAGADVSAIAFWSALLETHIGAARADLGAAADAAYAEGRTLTLEDVVAEVLAPR
jgi:predicted ATPase/class 3 adenylate cyclase